MNFSVLISEPMKDAFFKKCKQLGLEWRSGELTHTFSDGVSKYGYPLRIHVGGDFMTFCKWNFEDRDEITFTEFMALPEKKKRYWLWDCVNSSGWFKSDFYMDENGCDTTGRHTIDTLKRKHENEWIEI